jgi:hypothetical protein
MRAYFSYIYHIKYSDAVTLHTVGHSLAYHTGAAARYVEAG